MSNDEPMNEIPTCDYLKVNGRVYAVSEVANQELDIEEELKQFYNKKYQDYTEQFNSTIARQMKDDLEQQILHLQNIRDRGVITYPSDLIGRLAICQDGMTVYEARATIYHPTVFRMSASDIGNYLNIKRQDVRDESTGTRRTKWLQGVRVDGKEINLNDYPEDVTLDVFVKHNIYIPTTYAFNERTNKLYCVNTKTFHTMSDGRVCTGSHSASDFWDRSDFEDLMNVVNCFSLADSTVSYRHYSGTRDTWRIEQFVNASTITHINTNTEDDRWTTT